MVKIYNEATHSKEEFPMTNHLATDIDALALRVRDANSKRLIDDAISAYRAGALRSAVISTWNAVANDIIVKAQELHSLDEGRVSDFVEKLNNAIENDDVLEKIEIERNLLKNAENTLQLITSHEFDMLRRIRKDRHICAHPSLVKEDQLFEPTPDLVRSHIVNALDILLIHAPLQGKPALDRLMEDINSESFPSTQEGVRKFIYSKYLKSSKEVLVENLIKVIYKILVKGTETEVAKNKKHELAWIVAEIFSRHGKIFERVSKSFLSQPSNFQNNRSMLNICPIVGGDPRIWSWVDTGVQSQIKALIEKSSVDEMEEYFVLDALNINDISSSILLALEKMGYREQVKLISNSPHKNFVQIGIEMYRDSGSFDFASKMGRNIIMPLLEHFDADNIEQLLGTVKENNQIYACWDTEIVLLELLEKKKTLFPDTKKAWEDLLGHVGNHFLSNIRDKIKEIDE